MSLFRIFICQEVVESLDKKRERTLNRLRVPGNLTAVDMDVRTSRVLVCSVTRDVSLRPCVCHVSLPLNPGAVGCGICSACV